MVFLFVCEIDVFIMNHKGHKEHKGREEGFYKENEILNNLIYYNV